jgi:hypothetical protein
MGLEARMGYARHGSRYAERNSKEDLGGFKRFIMGKYFIPFWVILFGAGLLSVSCIDNIEDKPGVTTPFAAPTGLVIVSLDRGNAVIYWAASPSVTNYQVEWSENNDFTSAETIVVSTSSCTIPDLTMATDYWVRVKAVAVNSLYDSPYSSKIHIFINELVLVYDWDFSWSQITGSITSHTTIFPYFEIYATESYPVTIEPVEEVFNGRSFSKVLKTGGQGYPKADPPARVLKFSVNKSCSIIVYIASATIGTSCSLVLADATGTEIARKENISSLSSQTFKYRGSAGYLLLYSADNDMGVYMVRVMHNIY